MLGFEAELAFVSHDTGRVVINSDADSVGSDIWSAVMIAQTSYVVWDWLMCTP